MPSCGQCNLVSLASVGLYTINRPQRRAATQCVAYWLWYCAPKHPQTHWYPLSKRTRPPHGNPMALASEALLCSVARLQHPPSHPAHTNPIPHHGGRPEPLKIAHIRQTKLTILRPLCFADFCLRRSLVGSLCRLWMDAN